MSMSIPKSKSIVVISSFGILTAKWSAVFPLISVELSSAPVKRVFLVKEKKTFKKNSKIEQYPKKLPS